MVIVMIKKQREMTPVKAILNIKANFPKFSVIRKKNLRKFEYKFCVQYIKQIFALTDDSI